MYREQVLPLWATAPAGTVRRIQIGKAAGWEEKVRVLPATNEPPNSAPLSVKSPMVGKIEGDEGKLGDEIVCSTLKLRFVEVKPAAGMKAVLIHPHAARNCEYPAIASLGELLPSVE